MGLPGVNASADREGDSGHRDDGDKNDSTIGADAAYATAISASRSAFHNSM